MIIRPLVVALGILAASSVPVLGDYCITCFEPAVNYRCIPEDGAKLARLNIANEKLGNLCAKILDTCETREAWWLHVLQGRI